jgi:hypothetical protein
MQRYPWQQIVDLTDEICGKTVYSESGSCCQHQVKK